VGKKRGGKKSLIGLNSRVRNYEASQKDEQAASGQTGSALEAGHGIIRLNLAALDSAYESFTGLHPQYTSSRIELPLE
jgi:hypothetical protein